MTAAGFENYAMEAAGEIFRNKDVVIMVGGTGLYIKAFAEGLDEIPSVDPEVRKIIIAGYKERGIAWLQNEIQQQDPSYFTDGEMQNPHRMMRALEVKMSTGHSILNFRSRQKKARPFRIVKIGLELPRSILYQRINDRVNEMMAAGLLHEVQTLLPYQNEHALQTVGYRELFDYLDGRTGLDRAVELIKQNSRHYAKRQVTWFKKDSDIKWIDMRDAAEAVALSMIYADPNV